MGLPPGARLGPYTIELQLGRGGMGEVYRAHDPRLGRNVAVKIICDAPDPDAVRRFTREAQTASALNHPGIVSIFDVGESERGPFIVMELVEGRVLRDLLRSAPELTTVLRIGREVARALGAAHAAGIVHRDVKPENVMVRDDGHVKVLDFGISRVVPAQALTDGEAPTSTHLSQDSVPQTGGTLIGTVGYMSPEQARGEPVGPPTDVFALGVLLYELLAGRRPFHAADHVGSLARLLSDAALAPSHFCPDVPPGLDALILRMLDKDPRARPTAGEVDGILSELLGEHPVSHRRVTAAAASRHTVGHEHLRAELLDAFNRAEEGRGSLVALSGEPGIGKTTLVEDFVRDLAAGGRAHVFARGRCSERLAEAGAYLPWLEALESMRDDTGRSVSRVMQTLAPTWYAQVAPLAVSGDSPETRLLTLNRAGSQEWLKRELNTFLDEISRHGPLVLFLDDVQWADVSTVDLLAYLGTRLSSMRVLVLATYRPTDLLLSQHPFLRLKLNLQSRGICRDVGVTFLSEADIDRYLALEFAGHRFPATFAALVHAKTEGNPLFMTGLIQTLRDRHVLAQQDGTWRLTQEITAVEHDIPESIRAMIDLKIAQLDDADRTLLVAASVQGSQFDSAVAASALTLDQGTVEERLDALARIHALVQPAGEVALPDGTLTVRYRFVHALYQNALYRSLGPSRRASLSATVARAVIARHGQSPENASELALLFETARDFSRAAELFLIAADRARQIFADREALLLARRGLQAVRALPETPDRTPRELANLMGVALAASAVEGYASEGAEQISLRGRQLADQIGEHPQIFTFLAALGAFLFMRAELRALVQPTEQMFRLSERTGNPLMSIWSEWAIGSALSHVGEQLRAAYEHLDHGARLYQPSMHSGMVLMTSFDAGIGCNFQAARVLWLLGHPDRAIERARRATDMARRTRHPMMTHFSLFFEAWIRQYRREPHEVLRIAGEVLPEIDQYGYKVVGAWMRTMQGWALAHTGRPEEGERILRATIAETDAIGIKLLRPNALALLAESLAHQDRVDEALAVVAEGLAVAERSEERYYSSELHRLEGELLMRNPHAGAADRARQSLEAAIALARKQEARSFELRAATTLVRLLRQQGRAAEGRAALGNIAASFEEGHDTPDVLEARAELK